MDTSEKIDQNIDPPKKGKQGLGTTMATRGWWPMDVLLSAVNWPVCTFGHSIGFDFDWKIEYKRKSQSVSMV